MACVVDDGIRRWFASIGFASKEHAKSVVIELFDVVRFDIFGWEGAQFFGQRDECLGARRWIRIPECIEMHEDVGEPANFVRIGQFFEFADAVAQIVECTIFKF